MRHYSTLSVLVCLTVRRTIKRALEQMDEKLIDRDGIDKLQSLLPTEEEIKLIREFKECNEDTQLGKF